MDRRQQKTRNAILRAFSQLLAKKDFSRITVQEIIDGADVGRATFYAHFETKEYLLKELCKELFDHIIESAMGHTDAHRHYFDCETSDPVFLHLIGHLQKNDSNILELLSSENNELFLHYFKSDLKKLIYAQYINPETVERSGLPEDFLVNHIASCFVETVSWWLKSGAKLSASELAQYYSVLVRPFLGEEK